MNVSEYIWQRSVLLTNRNHFFFCLQREKSTETCSTEDWWYPTQPECHVSDLQSVRATCVSTHTTQWITTWLQVAIVSSIICRTGAKITDWFSIHLIIEAVSHSAVPAHLLRSLESLGEKKKKEICSRCSSTRPVLIFKGIKLNSEFSFFFFLLMLLLLWSHVSRFDVAAVLPRPRKRRLGVFTRTIVFA